MGKRAYITAAERALGRNLPAGAVVHHTDQNRQNGHNTNLVILQSAGEHGSLHRRLRVLEAGGNPWTQQLCGNCGELKLIVRFVKVKANANGRGSLCAACAAVRGSAYYNRKNGRPADRKETAAERKQRNTQLAHRRWHSASI